MTMQITNSLNEAPRELVADIDKALDKAFKAPFIDRSQLRKDLVLVFQKHNEQPGVKH
jgi:hypothetical protein